MSDTNQPREDSPEAQRRNKLESWRESGVAYPNGFERGDWASDLQREHADTDKQALEEQQIEVRLAGRIILQRNMGKAIFVTIRDASGDIQLYARQQDFSGFSDFSELDLGDLIGVLGTLFRTNRGELTLQVAQMQLLVKCLHPLPEKYHGLSNREQRYRHRYLDLMVNPESVKTFRQRSVIINALRQELNAQEFLEVETPMLQRVSSGAVATPFATHHKSLKQDMYLRIAPELNLKRLVVGGFERVYELNRCFRNEGLSPRHNPEFTMLEWYQAYSDFEGMMQMTEQLCRAAAEAVHGGLRFEVFEREYDFSKSFRRLGMYEALKEAVPELPDAQALRELSTALEWAERLGVAVADDAGSGKLLLQMFENMVEPNLAQPTFITDHPVEVSPLARRRNDDPWLAERFELFCNGWELANGFSELNDPQDQTERFHEQMRAREEGDAEAMQYDADYIQALEYGLPPTGGAGIGVDRLAMFLLNAASIRDVLLFPQMKPSQ